jgi:hypothetical protein
MNKILIFIYIFRSSLSWMIDLMVSSTLVILEKWNIPLPVSIVIAIVLPDVVAAGTVMGSKKLKTIAIIGTKQVPLYNPERIKI